MNADENAVASILKDYETALNGSDTEAAMKLYAPDGVFMPQHSLASIGTEAVRKAYEAVFAAITLTVKFEIAEIRQIAADWLLARTNFGSAKSRRKVEATRKTKYSSVGQAPNVTSGLVY
jgi:uncharacterized protein (TIGR02246 family)